MTNAMQYETNTAHDKTGIKSDNTVELCVRPPRTERAYMHYMHARLDVLIHSCMVTHTKLLQQGVRLG